MHRHRFLTAIPALASLFLGTVTATAAQFDTRVPMLSGGAATYYIEGQLGDLDATNFMVDTGSGFMTINQDTLDQLMANDLAHYERDLRGVLADGSELVVPIYRITRLNIGACVIEDVEAALFKTSRQIIGLSVLNRAAPFIFSVDPPELVLSHCATPKTTDNQVADNRLQPGVVSLP